MTPDERIADVRAQIEAMEAVGQSIPIQCPYCGGMAQPDAPFCCSTLESCCDAVLDRMDLEARKAHFDEVLDRAARN